MNKQFIAYLSNKLKTGNLRTIHLNALPGRFATRLDLTKLDLIAGTDSQQTLFETKEGKLSDNFLFTNLLAKSQFKFKINFENVPLTKLGDPEKKKYDTLANQLNALFNQNEDNFLEHGIKTFGFGYPLLIKRSKKDPTKFIKSPLLIWSLDINRSNSYKNQWSIEKTDESPIYLNEVLLSHIKNDEGINIEGISTEHLDDNLIDANELKIIIKNFLSRLNSDSIDLNIRIEPCLESKVLDNITPNKPWILWSGIFGLFRTQKQSIINDSDRLFDEFENYNFEDLKIEQFRTSLNTSVSTDPSQEEIISSLDRKEFKVIQGPPGTGKSQSLTAIITNTLENGGKILVVCEKKTALDVIYKNLKEIGLDKLVAFVDDVNTDRKRIIETVRSITDVVKYEYRGFNEPDYDDKLNRYKELITDFNQRHHNLLKTIFKGFNIQDIITEYLKQKKTVNSEIRLLDNVDLKMEHAEFVELQKSIEQAIDLYEGIPQDGFIFDLISNSNFQNQYTLKKENEIFGKFKEIKEVIESALDIVLEENVYNLKYTSFIRFLKSFSKKQKAIYNFWKKISTQQENINDLFITTNFSIDKANTTERTKVEKLKNKLDQVIGNKNDFKEYYDWRLFFDSQNSTTQKSLSNLIANSKPNKWISLFRFNYFNLFIESQENKLGNFNSNNKTLERIAEFQSELKTLQKHKILKLWEDKQFHSINDFNRRSNIKWLFNHRKNSQYSRKNSLRKIIHDEFDLFTNIFPVVLVNPVACSSIMPLKQNIFDVVLFDEASQLRLEDTYPALIRGKIKVISGDKHQMPPSNFFNSDISLDVAEETEEDFNLKETEYDKTNPLYLAESESLLDFGNNLNPTITNISYLDFHYRSRHPYLIEFSNAAFYGSRLIPMPEKDSYKPIRFFQTNGLYESTHTNPTEAQQIIKFIKSDYPVYDNGKYPSLGIATFNMQQRNLIKDLINEESIKDEEFRNKLSLIGEKEEWFVKNLENIQGDERDIIIISTTFGINSEGKFRQSFGPINTYKGYKLLNVIITRAKRQVYIFTSIPQENFTSNYQDEILLNGNRGKSILYAYLDYCNAIENNNEERRTSILELLKNGCEEETVNPNTQFVESPFEQEVYDYLIDYINKDRVVPQYKIGGYRIDFVLLNEFKKPIIAIECDGAAYHSTEHAYSHDLHRQKILENHGLKFFRIWSKSWWPDPNKEIYKLLNYIEAIDPSIIKKPFTSTVPESFSAKPG